MFLRVFWPEGLSFATFKKKAISLETIKKKDKEWNAKKKSLFPLGIWFCNKEWCKIIVDRDFGSDRQMVARMDLPHGSFLIIKQVGRRIVRVIDHFSKRRDFRNCKVRVHDSVANDWIFQKCFGRKGSVSMNVWGSDSVKRFLSCCHFSLLFWWAKSAFTFFFLTVTFFRSASDTFYLVPDTFNDPNECSNQTQNNYERAKVDNI